MSVLSSAGKAHIYQTNGTGRDTYIYNNSGGFTADKEPSGCAKLGNFFLKVFYLCRNYGPIKPLSQKKFWLPFHHI